MPEGRKITALYPSFLFEQWEILTCFRGFHRAWLSRIREFFSGTDAGKDVRRTGNCGPAEKNGPRRGRFSVCFRTENCPLRGSCALSVRFQFSHIQHRGTVPLCSPLKLITEPKRLCHFILCGPI